MVQRGFGPLFTRVLVLAATPAALTALFPSSASALPAWSRKYSVPCSTCHYPAPPRLNVYGQKFRRAQYRLPDEFNKEADWKSVGNYAAMRIRGGYDYDSPENGFPGETGVKSGFKLNDATLFFAGPVARNFSGFVELERPGNEEIIEAVVSIGGVHGTPDSFWSFRLGQFHTLARVGFGGLDRPTGLTTPLALSRALVSGNAFKLNQDQVGLEVTYVNGNSRIIGQILNGSSLTTGSPAAAATTDQADQNRDKDYVLAYELLWGKTASGLTVFGYDGRQDDLSGAADIVKIKIVKTGGLWPARKWIAVGEAAGLSFTVGHGIAAGIQNAAEAHLAFTIANLKMPGEMNGYLRVQDDVTAADLHLDGTDLLPPQTPGLGTTLEPEKLSRYALR